MHNFIEKFQNFSKFSRTRYIVKLSSYIKELLKFALFFWVEGGGQNHPMKSPKFICNDKNQCFFNAKF